jgi:hypothetical protein
MTSPRQAATAALSAHTCRGHCPWARLTPGSGTLNGSAQANHSTSSLAPGSHGITAVYGGDSNFTGSTSSNFTETVNYPVATITSLSLASDLTGQQANGPFLAIWQSGEGNFPGRRELRSLAGQASSS